MTQAYDKPNARISFKSEPRFADVLTMAHANQ